MLPPWTTASHHCYHRQTSLALPHVAEMERTFIAIKLDRVQRGLISEIISRFERKSFGSVYRGTLNDGRDVAVKVFDLQHQNAFKSFDVECEVLCNLRHRNLCKVISTCSNQDFKALVLEYMSNGSLEKLLYSDDCLLDILQRIHIMIDVASALEYMHYGYSTYIVHCDLKPSNVLLDEDMVAHLSDFGIAKLLGEGESNAHTTSIGTLGYIAPEYGLEGFVSIRCDVYSYGIMLMEVFTRTKPSSEIFSGELSLRSWINDSMPNAIARIIDSNLLAPEEEHYTEKLKCLSSVMELALNCSMESADERFVCNWMLLAHQEELENDELTPNEETPA
ncbi:putative LRR receptor-like serine/threonine-protein kinase [Forsythia ovata]|uniref:non-specific serine/threonine protein kinase n=1 Tax=Forsythia ovata TaxID=205694 RepID=A0ABD1WMP7_9LAMI